MAFFSIDCLDGKLFFCFHITIHPIFIVINEGNTHILLAISSSQLAQL